MPASQTKIPDPYKFDPDTLRRQEKQRVEEREDNDRLIGVILLTTCILLVANSVALHDIMMQPQSELVQNTARITLVAFLLNLALLFLGWRRYHDLQKKISSYVSAEKRAHRLAVTDTLTSFYNRRALLELTEDLISRANEKDQAVAFLLIDIDNFKQINDIHGHSTGDFILCEFAERVRKIAPKRAYLARLGGDEFAFSFAFYADVPQEATRFAEAIIAEMQRPFVRDGLYVETTVSIGIARHDAERESGQLHDLGELMRRADLAMYEAKNAGKNSISWFDKEMEEELRSRMETENAVRQGILDEEFVPCFEPLIDMKSGAVVGFELLSRWNNPARRHIKPGQFIRIAQEIGLIDRLTVSVIEQAFVEAREWDRSLILSINISPTQLLDEKIAQLLLQSMMTTGFPAHRLEIEVTEGAIFKNADLAKTIICSLKNQGIRVAYDDFGTGYSSLTHLRELPFDRVKIDHSYITKVTTDGDMAEMVRAIVSLCSSLRLPVTAEGIENQEIHDYIAGLGEVTGQGYHYGRGMSLADARHYLAARNLLPSRRSDNSDAEPPAPLISRKAG